MRDKGPPLWPLAILALNLLLIAWVIIDPSPNGIDTFRALGLAE